MSDLSILATRAAMQRLFGTPEYMTWASRVGNLIDARKIAEEFQGRRKTRCGTEYGKALQDMCRANPPQNGPVPPPPPALADIWRRDAAFTEGGLSNFNSAPRDAALATGWSAVYVQLLHTTYGAANLAEMMRPQWNPWAKVGWGTYGQDSDPEQDGRDAAAICKANPVLKGWKANGEAWAEGANSWKTEAFLEGWKEGGAPVPLGWSVLSSDTDQSARSFAYGVAMTVVGADIDPQVYGALVPTYTVGACLGMLARVSPVPVPVNRTTMTFDVNGDGNGPFGDYKTWPGPRRLWRPDKATVATFQALVRP